jgi:glycosyltransferase involved in cell wall biosynthesis
MRKKRILMVGEHHIAKSGFGLYTREILSRLHNTGKYTVAELSCFNSGTEHSSVPWKVYPNGVPPQHELEKQYNADPANVFGKWRFDQVVLDFRPDIVFDIRDFWMLEYEGISLLRPYFHWVVAPTVDSLPQQLHWLQTFSTADVVLGHTDWAVEYMKDVGHNINALTSVSDSVDTDVFRPLNYSLTFNRAQHFVPEKAFIVGSVMRNQKRKLIPNLMGIIKNLRTLTHKTDIFLYLHTSYPERSGWDIPALLQEYDAYNFVLFTYFCHSCTKAYASHWKGDKTICPFCGNKSATFPNVVKGLTDSQLKNIYNLFDVYMQYAICEGLGIPQLEAASCGVPICSVDYSAMGEVTSKLDGDKISYALFKELETGAFRAIPNDGEAVATLFRHLQQSIETKKKNKEHIRQKILDNYSWDKTTEKYIEIFDSLEPKNMWEVPLSMNPSFKVNSNSTNRQFVTTIIKNVIQSPHLLQSTYIQNMIRYLDEGYINAGGNIVGYNIETAKKNLEQLLNHKVILEKIRSKEVIDNSEFLKYGQ